MPADNIAEMIIPARISEFEDRRAEGAASENTATSVRSAPLKAIAGMTREAGRAHR